MNCNCKSDLEKKLLERFIEKEPGALEPSAELTGYGFGFTETGTVLIGYMPFKITATHPLKNGGTKRKSSTSNMHFSYCPFCGVKA